MGCAYAEGSLDKCQCVCGGVKHGLLVPQIHAVAVKCSPAVEKRCKAGNEDGACTCKCGGINHGLYKEIADFGAITINEYSHGVN